MEQYYRVVVIAGGASLLIIVGGEALLIRGEINRDEAGTGAEGGGEGATEGQGKDGAPLTQLSSFWVGLGLVVATSENVPVAKRYSLCKIGSTHISMNDSARRSMYVLNDINLLYS